MEAIKGDNIDFAKSNETKQKMKILFEKAVEDNNGYRLLYAYETVDKPLYLGVTTIHRYTYHSYVLGYRDYDMSMIFVHTTPEFANYDKVEKFMQENIRSAVHGKMLNNYVIYRKKEI